MMNVSFMPAALDHIEAMKGRFRPEDVAELWAAAHRRPEETLRLGVKISPVAWTAFIDGNPVAIFGVSPASMLGNIGCPWMVGTLDLDRHAYILMKASRPFLAKMLQAFRLLVNYVDARNVKAIRWLRKLGFRFSDAAPHGIEGMPFHRFEMEASDV